MIGVITGEREFSTTDHIRVVKEKRWDRRKYQDDVNDAKLQLTISDQGTLKKHLFLRDNHMKFWLSVWGTTVTSTELAATESREFVMRVL